MKMNLLHNKSTRIYCRFFSILVCLFTCSSLLLTSCAFAGSNNQKSLSENRESLCDVDSLVGETKKIELYLDANWSSLDSIKGKLGGQLVEHLSQELQGYSKEWESLNRHGGPLVSCRLLADCKFYNSRPGSCIDELDRYERAQDKTRDLIFKLMELEMKMKSAGQ